MTHKLKGKKQSPEHIQKRVQARWNNGTYCHNQETRQKMSETRKGRRHTEEWKKELSKRMSSSHPMKGRKHTKEARLKMSLSRRGVPRPDLRGSKSHFWKGGKTQKSIKARRSVEYRNWRDFVFKRDDYTCQDCGKKGGELSPDHIMPISLYPEMAFDHLNGRTLCRACHIKTDTFGGNFKKYDIAMVYLIENHS